MGEMENTTERWMARMDAIGSYCVLEALRRLIDEAPDGARRTADYWYARGVVDVRTESEAQAHIFTGPG